MNFRLLGMIEVRNEHGLSLAVAPRERIVLAVLLLNTGQTTSRAQLIDTLWGAEPPPTARDQLYTCVHQLRRLLNKAGIGAIATVTGGYRIEIGSDALDSLVFARLVDRAHAASVEERWNDAIAGFQEAEALWRGPALDGIDNIRLRDIAAGLDEKRLNAAEHRLDLQLRHDPHNDLVPELTGLVLRYPSRERLRVTLVRALHQTGRTVDALAVYDQARTWLANERGLDPGPELRELHQAILRDQLAVPMEPVLLATDQAPRRAASQAPSTGQRHLPHKTTSLAETVRAHRLRLGLTQEELADASSLSARGIRKLENGRITVPRPATIRLLADALGLGSADRDQLHQAVMGARATTPSQRFVPAQLPANVAGFTGRVEQLGLLDTLLLGNGAPAGAVAVTAISGMAGVGKTSLAVHWAHRVAGRFPDGQLYADLRGFGPEPTPVSAADVVRDFLAAFQVPPEQVPASLDAQLGLYRSLLVGKRILILLDNARDADQVRQLLPGSPGCAAVVTSRNQLASLVVAPGAYLLALDLLPADEAHDLLGRRLGHDRLAAEPAAAGHIVAQCAGLPLALAIVTAQACARPALPLAKLAARIWEAPNVLDGLAGNDAATDARQVFAWSYQALSPAAARLFRLLSLHPGPDVTPVAAASLANLPPAAASALLAELTTAHLVTSPALDRYALHDLLRAYAAELAVAVDPGPQLQAARRRLLDSYLRMALAAADALAPNRSRITPACAPGPVPANAPTDDQAARAWFDAERRTLRAAVTLSTRTGFDAHSWQLAWATLPYWERCGRWHDAVSTQQEALTGAQRLADRTGEAHTSRLVGYALTRLNRPDDAWHYLARALDLFSELGDQVGQACAHANIYIALGQQQRLQDALRHARKALALHRAAGNSAAVPGALNNLGVAYGLVGDYRRSLACGRRALALFQQRGHRHGEAAAWDTIGHAHHQLGAHSQAITCYLSSLAAYRAIDSRSDQVEVLTHLGDAYHAAGDRQAARDRWTQAISILEEIGHPGVDDVRGKLMLLAQTGNPLR